MPFQKGHKGFKPEGAISQKTRDWELMRDKMTGTFTDKSIEYIEKLWKTDTDKAFKCYLELLEYFKPKQSRTDIVTDGEKIDMRPKVIVNSQEEAEKLNRLIDGTE